MRHESELEVGGKRLKVSNLKKVLYPKAGFTKGEVIDYYIRISPVLLPHLKNRPLTLKRYPNGVEGEFFYEKKCPSHRPAWVNTARVWSEGNQADINYCLSNDLPTLVWAANLADLELHTSLARYPKIQSPTMVVFDLDPGAPADIVQCCQVGLWLRKILNELKLKCFAKTSGSKGLQIYVPLNTPTNYEITKKFAKNIAERLEREHPELVVSKMAKALRAGKIFVDWSQNDDHKTTVCVYSLRAKESPTVSTPLIWDEVEATLKKGDPAKLVFQSTEVLKRVQKLGDLFEPILKLKQRLNAKSLAAMKKTVFDDMGLKAYQAKRNFRRTSEPKPRVAKKRPQKRKLLFVIQKHDATRLHYDFRLEMEGVLKSWAVPKGIPMQRGEKHLAIHVEDHPLDYAYFEGTIPEGNYGAGTVMVWDTGTYEISGAEPLTGLKEGKLHVKLSGKKLKGEWALVRIKPRPGEKESWLLFKGGENRKPFSKKKEDESALTGRSMKKIESDNDAQWGSNRGKSSDKKTSANRLEKVSVQKTGFITPMKCRLMKNPPKGDEWIYEIKFDGFRALAIKRQNDVELLSRSEKDLTPRFPGIAEAVRALPCRHGIFDGEIVALDEQGRSSFQLLQMSNMLGQPRAPLCFYVFDLLNLDGLDLTKFPLARRKGLLQALIKPAHDPIRFSADIHGDPEKILVEIRKRGLEGIIAKRTDAKYEAGQRSGSWVKIKLVNEQDFVIGGYTAPKGSRDFFGAILVGYFQKKKFIFASKVGTGFNQALLTSLHNRFRKLKREDCPFVNLPQKRSGRYGQGITAAEMKRCTWVDPKFVCQINFAEWTREGHLRHPVFIGVREDRNPNEVVKEKPQ